MKTQSVAITFAALCGALCVSASNDARAADVGHYLAPSCASATGNFAAAITAAGHTPVSITTLDNSSLAGLEGLVIELCSTSPVANAAVDTAVANGMGLVYNTWRATSASAANLPGAPSITFSNYYDHLFCGVNSTIAPGAPIASGPGGSLTDSSLDGTSYCALDSYATSASLPGGAIPFVTTTDPTQVGAFGYQHGAGRVAFSSMSLAALINGGISDPLNPGLTTYLTNAVAWVTNAETTTCASSGYTGTKLNWCKIICESEASSSTVDTYLRRWINKYRDLPYCAVEGGGEEPPPQGD